MPDKRKKSAKATAPPSKQQDQLSGEQQPHGNAAAQQALKKQRQTYNTGQHGAKTREQDRLTGLFDETVSGDTHESEHTIGFEPLNQTTGLKRGTAGRARTLENQAPAYQESKEMHRGHIGTGTTNEVDASGFNSHTYRDSQRSLVESGDVSDAVQLNQLGYAFLEDEDQGRVFQAEKGWQKEAADNSYANMVTQMDSVTYGQGEDDVSVDVSPIQKVEMLSARDAARTGEWPSRDQLREHWASLGHYDPYEQDEEQEEQAE